MSDTETYSMTGIPDDKLDQFLIIIKNDPRYISHTVIKEGDGKNTVTVTVSKLVNEHPQQENKEDTP